MKTIKTPTGYIIIDTYEKGELETLSIGDYGKSKNIKADFLGYTDEIDGVPNGDVAPLQEKWVITLSTQYGCSMDCKFCDCPKIDFKGNVSFEDLKKQLYSAIALYPDVKYTDRLNVHFARMGEPVFNPAVLEFAKWMQKEKLTIQKETGKRFEVIHPVFTTCVPKNLKTFRTIKDWADIKNDLFNGQAGLQISINSTDEDQRKDMFNNKVYPLEGIAAVLKNIREPIGRKYCLNFAIADGNVCDGERLAKLFDPKKWMVKITPIHNNNACEENGYKTVSGYTDFYPYKEAEECFKKAGFDVLVFIPSMDEENNLITCGNAVLGGSTFK